MILTVRQWFRLLRGQAWRAATDRDTPSWLPVVIYFRQEPQNHDYGPFRTVGIYTVDDVRSIVDAGCVGDPPEKIFRGELQMRLSTTGRPSEAITH